MQQTMVVRDKEVLKSLISPIRSKILQLLINEELAVQQLANKLETSAGSAYYHVKGLQDAGLVEETRTEMEKNIMMRFYRAVARQFKVDFSIITDEADEEVTKWVKSRVESIITGLQAYNIVIPKEKFPDAVKYLTELVNLENKIKEEISPTSPELLNNIAPSIREDISSLMEMYHQNQDNDLINAREKLISFLRKYEKT
ncbi:helix-turn-helix domain-containing protein [Candidatus Borrarchaeum sp.]|uniref:ArsR/SmtB family transcription factor n=1 Tax=Candidatus Borrarchaeum sp. TaxID=2846742 RepID=UPI00257F45AA|nr:helix-turn-helix domain-containing protein [Candidatus Borrarchaeum sp.]